FEVPGMEAVRSQPAPHHPAPRPPPTPRPTTTTSKRLEMKSFEIARLRDREQDGMIAGLAEALDDAHPHPGVAGCMADTVLEHRVGHMVRAREREEAPVALEDPKRAQVDLLVAARRRVERRAAARERRRIQDDRAEADTVALEAPQLVEDVSRPDL